MCTVGKKLLNIHELTEYNLSEIYSLVVVLVRQVSMGRHNTDFINFAQILFGRSVGVQHFVAKCTCKKLMLK